MLAIRNHVMPLIGKPMGSIDGLDVPELNRRAGSTAQSREQRDPKDLATAVAKLSSGEAEPSVCRLP